jgi:hypothetical protein
MKNWKARLVQPLGYDEYKLGYEVGKPIPNINSMEDMQIDINLRVRKLGFTVSHICRKIYYITTSYGTLLFHK